MTQIEIKPPQTSSGRPVVPTRPRSAPADAAADAAGFLRRLGFAVMVGLLPIAAVLMRHAVVGIAPVGAILFSLAAKMVRLNRDLRSAVTIQETAKSLFCPELGTRYRALSADATTAFGLSPAFCIFEAKSVVRARPCTRRSRPRRGRRRTR